MSQLPAPTGAQLVKALRKLGFEVIRTKGSHRCEQHYLTGEARASRVPSTICRGEAQAAETETIYPPAPIAEHDLMSCECRAYADFGTGGLCRDLAAQRCYKETI